MELAKAAILEKLARLYADAIILDKAIAADKVEADGGRGLELGDDMVRELTDGHGTSPMVRCSLGGRVRSEQAADPSSWWHEAEAGRRGRGSCFLSRLIDNRLS